MRQLRLLALTVLAAPLAAPAQAPIAPPDPLAYSQALIAFTHVQLVDGTGAKARADMTVVEREGRITAIGPSASTQLPADATVIDGTGKTLLPGFVMMHEHMFYPVGRGNYTETLSTFPPLYLAGGTTSMRTAGSMSPYADLNLREEIKADRVLGPDLDVTGPYLTGPGLPVLKMHALTGPDDARRTVNYWADEGVTSLKGFMYLTRAELKAIIETGHRRGLKVTAHLCSITLREAADMGIDNLEHAFAVATDFDSGKRLDVCPDPDSTARTLGALDPDSVAVKDLIHELVSRHVALTSTLTVFETYTPGRPQASERARALLIPEVRVEYETTWAAVQKSTGSPWRNAFPKEMKLEKMFYDAGGYLMAGTDPSGYGGVIPGFSSKRQIELMVEAGFPFETAIQICSLNGAKFMGRDRDVGSVEVGKRADLVLIDGDPLKDPMAIERMPLVFKAGKGYRTDIIIGGMQGQVGLY